MLFLRYMIKRQKQIIDLANQYLKIHSIFDYEVILCSYSEDYVAAVNNIDKQFKINPYHFESGKIDFTYWTQIILHEIAHIIVFKEYGKVKYIHGKEFKNTCELLKCEFNTRVISYKKYK